MKPALRSLLLVVVALQSGRVASSWAAPAPADARGHAADEQARQSFTRGEQLFRSQKYREAAAEFEAGYRLSPSPAFLFDLALTHRALGNSQQAISYYQQYLNAQPNAADRPAVEAAIAEEQSKLAKAPAAPAPAMAAVVAKPSPPPTPAETVSKASFDPPPTSAAEPGKEPAMAEISLSKSDRPVEQPVWKKWWFWTATGAVAVGAVAIGLGVGLSKFGTEPYKEVTWR